jgi:CRP/FNR family transcriptional regulator
MEVHSCRACPLRVDCIFAGLGEEELEELERHACWVSCPKRQAIYQEGDPVLGLYIIYKGKVKLYKRSLDGRRQIFQILGATGLLGEEALAGCTEYASTAEALTDVELLFLSRDDIRALLEYPSVAERLFERLLNRLHQTEELLLETHYGRADERLRRLLLQLAREHGRPRESGLVLIDLELTQTELGELCGLTREAVNKHLALLKERGQVVFYGRKLAIDPTTLWNALPSPSRPSA